MGFKSWLLGTRTGVSTNLPEMEENQVVMRADIHCSQCAEKVKQWVRMRFTWVSEVKVDLHNKTMVLKGHNIPADVPLMAEWLRRKSRKEGLLMQVEVISIQPLSHNDTVRPSSPDLQQHGEQEQQQEFSQWLQIMTLKLSLHCEGCARKMKAKLLKVKGVEKVKIDFESSTVKVFGVYDSERVTRCIGKLRNILVEEVKEELIEIKSENQGPKNGSHSDHWMNPSAEATMGDWHNHEMHNNTSGGHGYYPNYANGYYPNYASGGGNGYYPNYEHGGGYGYHPETTNFNDPSSYGYGMMNASNYPHGTSYNMDMDNANSCTVM